MSKRPREKYLEADSESSDAPLIVRSQVVKQSKSMVPNGVSFSGGGTKCHAGWTNAQEAMQVVIAASPASIMWTYIKPETRFLSEPLTEPSTTGL